MSSRPLSNFISGEVSYKEKAGRHAGERYHWKRSRGTENWQHSFHFLYLKLGSRQRKRYHWEEIKVNRKMASIHFISCRITG